MPWGAFAPLPIRLGGNPEEGWAPEQHARFSADLVAIKRTAPLARLYCNQDSGSPFAASITYYFGQNGAGTLYAPTVTVGGAGDVSVTFPSYWTDDYERQHPLKIRQAIARPHAAAGRFPTCTITGNVVRVRTVTDAGVASATPFSLRVW
ncbi:MAG TPA: hypothetical protein VL494_13760 [Steroidobacteraceae bacterium]|jgi:hypothetical protein|nr:hypothetical protein [Steroidobacteraceae bacterium]